LAKNQPATVAELRGREQLPLALQPCRGTTRTKSSTSSKLLVYPSYEVIIMAKGNNAQGKDKKKAKATPKKNATAAAKKPAGPRKA
jgi:hypothetical protein